MSEKQPITRPRKSFKLNLVALLTILSLLVISYCITDVDAYQYQSQHLLKEIDDNNDNSPFESSKSNKKNIIMMVTDGTGPSSFNMARYYNQFINNLNFNDTLVIDKYLIGQSRTRSSSSLITDSAAGATAFSCGLKSYNGAIGVDEFQNPCGTILEALKLRGYKTGLVVTTSITDATPAAFSSHVDFRSMQDLIASQQLGINTTFGNVVDLMIGGGRCSFLPKSDINGCRNDEINLINYAKENGWDVSLNKEEFDKLNLGLNKEIKLPILSLLAYYNIPYEIDRNDKKFPSLYEETITALNILERETKDSDEGFFLMIEGSRIDHAGHHNDPHAQVREILAYDKAFEKVIEFAKNSEVETYIISTSDHETGGIDIGRQITNDYPDYIWYPEVLANAKHSGEFLNFKLNEFLKQQKNIKLNDLKSYIKDEILEKDLGILDYENNELKEILQLIYKEENEESKQIEEPIEDEKLVEIKEVDAASEVVEYLKNMVSVRARIGWSTHGHTAADVNIYGYCNKPEGMQLLRENLGGNVENTVIGDLMSQIAGVNLNEVTKELLK
jgi:alkaline phosphatase